MAAPTKITYDFSFLDHTVNDPDIPQPGDKLDEAFAEVKRASDETIDRLNLVQRDDGELGRVVGPDQLKEPLFTEFQDLSDQTKEYRDDAAASATVAAASAANAATSESNAANSATSAAGSASTAHTVLNNLDGGTTGQVLQKQSNNDYDYQWAFPPGGGDMVALIYDPTGKAADVFSMGNMVETAAAKILTADERGDIEANTTARHTHANKNILDATTASFTAEQEAKLASVAEGAQVTSVSGRAGAVTLTKDDVGLGHVDNTPDIEKPVSEAMQEALDAKVDRNGGTMVADPTDPLGVATMQFVQAAVAAAGVTLHIVVFTSSGTYTPSAGLKAAAVFVIGGGGGGGASTSTGDSSAGGTSSFGNFCSATGSSKSGGSNGVGEGGAGSGGDLNITGQNGQIIGNVANLGATESMGGQGPFGFGFGTGGRGSGGSSKAAYGGGAGGGTLKIIDGSLIGAPVSVTVGAAGTGANGGTNGVKGAVIVVECV